jgi:hypothetical protein
MLNFNLDKETEKLIELCETPIEIELFLKIMDFVILGFLKARSSLSRGRKV